MMELISTSKRETFCLWYNDPNKTPRNEPSDDDDEDEDDSTGDYVDLIFIDDKFGRADFHFKTPYTREQWKMLAEINASIEDIEIKKARQQCEPSS